MTQPFKPMQIPRTPLVLILLGGLAACNGGVISGDEPGDESSLAAASVRSITLRTAIKQKFLVAEDGGGGIVNANRDAASTWETFSLHDLDGGALQNGNLVNLSSMTGKFVCAENGGGGAVNANRDQALDWETFRVIKITPGDAVVRDGDQIALQTKTSGLFVSALEGGGGGLVANGPAAGGWEALIVGGGGAAPAPPPPPPPAPGWTLTWADDFNGAAGSGVDRGKWNFDVGGGGFGNNELEYYTDRTSNAALDGNGNLNMVARAENYGGRNYTSARINTGGRFSQAYGRFEARIQLPSGKGIWPAFWTLGDNIGDPNVGWPKCGELDIMEVVGDFSVNHGSAHGPGYSGGNPLTGVYYSGVNLAASFHTYAMEWEPGEVRWYVDNNLYERRTRADLPPGTNWVYDHPFFIILNIAVGGNWPGSPDGSTSFPQTMKVDYVHVYKK